MTTKLIAELTGDDLNRAVAKVLGLRYMTDSEGAVYVERARGLNDESIMVSAKFKPASNWFQGGQIVEEYMICLHRAAKPKIEPGEVVVQMPKNSKEPWGAYAVGMTTQVSGVTALEAAMRAFVYFKIGKDSVEV